jgi:hypothetical protein
MDGTPLARSLGWELRLSSMVSIRVVERVRSVGVVSGDGLGGGN